MHLHRCASLKFSGLDAGLEQFRPQIRMQLQILSICSISKIDRPASTVWSFQYSGGFAACLIAFFAPFCLLAACLLLMWFCVFFLVLATFSLLIVIFSNVPSELPGGQHVRNIRVQT